MKNLPKLKDLDTQGKRVLVRVDFDCKDLPARAGEPAQAGDSAWNKRQEVLLPTLGYLTEKAAKIILLGHRGRPGGKVNQSLSLKPAADKLEKFLIDKWGKARVAKLNMYAMENLRFNPGEEANDEDYSKHLASEGDVYINEAFATSHRKHASIVGVPKYLSHAAGFRFIEEVENLTKVLENPGRPVVVIVGGAKKDKLENVESFKKFADRILIGGKLPTFLPEDYMDEKVVLARLNQDKKDITVHSIEAFKEEIAKAKTLVVAGPMGEFETEGQRLGTEKVIKAVSESTAFKVVGGGDTERAISLSGLADKFDWISAGGGAMLEFLSKGTLPGIQALLL